MEPLFVSIGMLRSVSEFHYVISSQLPDLRLALVEKRPVCWDFRPLQLDGRQSIAALTCFVSFASLVGNSFPSSPETVMRHDKKLLSFLKSLGVLELVRKLAFLKWQEGMVGDLEDVDFGGRIEYFQRPESAPEYGDSDWGEFKDQYRPKICNLIAIRLKSSLEKWRVTSSSAGRRHDQLIESIAELILNCWTWGGDDAFVGIQVNSSRLTVAVVDSGRGFLKSMKLRQSRVDSGESVLLPKVESEKEAIALGVILNHEFYALRGAINFVMSHGGWVQVGSNQSELHIQEGLWKSLESRTKSVSSGLDVDYNGFLRNIGESIVGSPGRDKREFGFSRTWTEPLRGSRVVFEIMASK